MSNKNLADFTVADALALVARLKFGPLEALSGANRLNFPECFPGTLVSLDPSYVPPVPGALRVVLLDGEQGCISVIDLGSATDPEALDPEIHLRVGAPTLAG